MNEQRGRQTKHVGRWATIAGAIGAMVAAFVPSKAEAATRVHLAGTPFESDANQAALPRLARGETVQRSTASKNLTADDIAQLRALGIAKLHSAAIVLHKVPKGDGAAIAARLGELTRVVDKMTPSGACDVITPTGDNAGLCSGTAPGPLGKVRLRMPFATKLTQDPNGTLHLVFANSRAMEAKPLFGWTTVVERERLKMLIDLYQDPADGGWLVYTRLGVEMKKYESSAQTVADAMIKLDAWLARDLAAR